MNLFRLQKKRLVDKSVVGLFLFLGSKMKSFSLDQVTYIMTLLNDGKSVRNFADIIGSSKSTFIKYRKTTVNELLKNKMG